LLAVEGDIADPAGTGRVIDAALERFGRLDTLVNNADVFISKPFTDYAAADYADVVEVSLPGFSAVLAGVPSSGRSRGRRCVRSRR
jgi:NAD(P)-dependent dehydrogenase (short-subunit alcohol dehydrogenase family)